VIALPIASRGYGECFYSVTERLVMNRDLAHEADMRALYREQLEADCGNDDGYESTDWDDSLEAEDEDYYVKPNERQIW
jgi:hypothetical protein